jgi:DNA polymerase III gamma/tau subunit
MQNRLKGYFKILKQKKESDFSGSFLLYGEKGINKLQIAKKIASIFLNLDGEKILKSPDFYFINSIESIKICEVRKLNKNLSLSSFNNYRVVVINNCHHLTKESANALLKAIEEPGKKVIFVLITDKIQKILPTIKSRCLCIYLGLESKNEISKTLLNSGKSQKLSKDIASLSLGRNEIIDKIQTQKDFEIRTKEIENIFDGLFINSLDESFLWALKIVSEKQRLVDVLDNAQVFVKDLIFVKTKQGNLEYIFLENKYLKIISGFKESDLLEINSKILDYFNMVEYNISEKLLLENLILLCRKNEI